MIHFLYMIFFFSSLISKEEEEDQREEASCSDPSYGKARGPLKLHPSSAPASLTTGHRRRDTDCEVLGCEVKMICSLSSSARTALQSPTTSLRSSCYPLFFFFFSASSSSNAPGASHHRHQQKRASRLRFTSCAPSPANARSFCLTSRGKFASSPSPPSPMGLEAF
jgi:hypothetical protein